MKERFLFSTNLHGTTLQVGSQVPGGGGEHTVLEGAIDGVGCSYCMILILDKQVKCGFLESNVPKEYCLPLNSE